jgi:hypothetical protein
MAEAKAWVMIPKSDKKATEIVIDMRPLVLCKDCKHGEKVNSVYLCGKSRGFGIAHDPDWFCADGKRR